MADKNSRLNSQFSSIASFWKPDSPDEVTTGYLKVDGDGIHFVTSPHYARGSDVGHADLSGMELTTNPRTAVLHGFFGEGNCTILQMSAVSRPGLTSYEENPQSIVSTDYRAAALVSGMHTGGFDDKCIDSARYTFTSLAEWLITPVEEEWGEKHVLIKVPLEETGLLDLCLIPSCTRIELKVRHELTTGEASWSRHTRPVAIVEVTSSTPESLSWFAGIGNRLENLFSLLIGSSIGMETLFIYRGEQSGSLIRKQHEYATRYKVFDAVRYTHSQLANSIAIWMSEYDGLREIENLLLGVLRKGKLFIETQFLSLAQALEGFHRATGVEIKLDKAEFKALRKKIENFLSEQQVHAETATQVNSAIAFANETSFRSRLRELCGRISEDTLQKMNISPEQFTAEVVHIRNVLTHAGGSSSEKEKPLERGELFLLSQKMRALLRGAFLLHLGFPEGQIAELIIREATKWKIND